MDSNDVAIEDVRQILAALGLGTHARPYSAHEVVQREVLPALQRLVEQAAESARLRAAVWRVEELCNRLLTIAHDSESLTAVVYRQNVDRIRRALDGTDG